MGNCSRCYGYMEGSGVCPACRRAELASEEQARNYAEQEWAQERMQAEAKEHAEKLQHQALIQEFTKKLLDLALESLQNLALASEKIKVMMRSPTFDKNEEYVWKEIEANRFLADSYYAFRLGVPPALHGIRCLPNHAKRSLGSYIHGAPQTPQIKELDRLHKQYLLEERAEQERKAEAARIQEAAWKKESDERERQQNEERRRLEEKRLSAESKRASSVRWMTRFYVLIHACGVFYSVTIKDVKAWNKFNWGVWLLVAAIYISVLSKWLGECFRENYSEYQKERFLGFSGSFKDKPNLIFDGYGAAFKYELIFSISVLAAIIKYTIPGASRVFGCIGFALFLLVRPLRRMVHYALFGLIAGIVSIYCANGLVHVLEFGKKIIIGDSSSAPSGLERQAQSAAVVPLENKLGTTDASPPTVLPKVERPESLAVGGQHGKKSGKTDVPLPAIHPDLLDGITVGDLDDANRQRLRIPRSITGALVTSVDPNSIAAGSGIRSGDVIQEINRRPIVTTDEAVRLSEELVAESQVPVKVYSVNGSRSLVLGRQTNPVSSDVEPDITADATVIQDYYRALGDRDLGKVLNFLAESVDYFDKGRIPKAKAVEDIKGDWQRYQNISNQVSDITRNPDGSLSFVLDYQLMQGNTPRAGMLKMTVRLNQDPTPKIVLMKAQVLRAR